MHGWLEEHGDDIVKAFGYLPQDAKRTMLRWTLTLPGMGKIPKNITWRYLFDQPATRLTAVFLAHLSFSYAFSGMGGVAAAV